MNLFVDSNRAVHEIYNMGDWEKIDSSDMFRSHIYGVIFSDRFPKMVSFDFDVDTPKGGVVLLKFLVDLCISRRIALPKIYLHCDNRDNAIHFENVLDIYTKSTKKSYSFQFFKRF